MKIRVKNSRNIVQNNLINTLNKLTYVCYSRPFCKLIIHVSWFFCECCWLLLLVQCGWSSAQLLCLWVADRDVLYLDKLLQYNKISCTWQHLSVNSITICRSHQIWRGGTGVSCFTGLRFMVHVGHSKQMETFGRFLKTFITIYQTTCCHMQEDCDPCCQLLTATSIVNVIFI